ncbi:unnamed protein product [Clonostachys byssicola]|uniref:Uncharacterized protein n=1 Tax=Clonostachys byssicola TaxID=160290 RepID=A0A9N9UVF2_9HYPO|nr:unnamed protein product [Clonostachys byssicola]
MSANGTDPTTLTAPVTATASESTGPYSRAFEEQWTGNQAHPQTDASQEHEWAEVMTALARRRPSLAHSMFSPASFSNFQAHNIRAGYLNKSSISLSVIPTLIGQQQLDQLPGYGVLFNNLKPLTKGTIQAIKPEIYYGANPSDLGPSIRDELAGYVVPSTDTSYPMAPNFFLEVKGPNVSKAEITRRACRLGAIGSRAMHILRNYKEDQAQYDGKPYTFSSTYVAGTLNIFAHHIAAPKTPGGRPEYQMTLVGSWNLIGDIDSFRSGVAAFRNARDLAKQYRDRLVEDLKARVARCRNQMSPRVKLEPED